MRKSEELWLGVVHDDYDSFISSFHDRYTTNDYSIVWIATLPCPPNAPYDRMDRWELTLFKLNRTVELQSNLRIRNKYTGRLNETVNCEMYDEVKFEIIDESISCHYCYCENNARKIVNDSLYEEIENTPSTKHLALGNSYLEHLLICDFLNDEVAYFLWKAKIRNY